MKCLYCGGPLTLALLKKITGAGEFCSDECRRGYQSEFNRLAVGRLQQARANRRLVPASGGTTAPEAPAPFTAQMRPISEAPPAPDWIQQPLPAPTAARGAEAEAKGIPEPAFLAGESGPALPRRDYRIDVEMPAAVPELASLFEAVQPEPGKAPAVESETKPLAVAAPKVEAQPAQGEEEVWMAPRGLFALTVSVQASRVDLKIPPVTPAPIFVYLQLPESLIASSVGRARLAVVAPVATGVRAKCVTESPSPKAFGPMPQGLRSHQALRLAERVLAPPMGFLPAHSSGLQFSWPAKAEPVLLSSLRFRAPAAVVVDAFSPALASADARFDVYLRPDGRRELREKLRGLSERRARQRQQADSGDTVTLPLKTVEPALNLLAAFGTAMLERQNRLGDLPAAMTAPPPVTAMPAEELLPKLVAGLTSMPLGDQPQATSPGGSWAPQTGQAGGGTAGPHAPAAPGVPGGPAATGQAHSEPVHGAPYGASAPSTPPPSYPAPAAGPDGLPSGWPADVAPPAELTPAASGRSQKPAVNPPDAPAMPEAPAAPLPGMPPINGNVYMFGTEINAGGDTKKDDENTSTALARTKSNEVEKAGSTEAENTSGEPNFTRPNGFPLSGGGMMNVGTMVVVNQPSGTVNINANSATASTFESRLRKKEPTPLSSIAEPAGLQIPPAQPAKELPLRMNFQGRLDTALPVTWPELEMAPMRKKMFFGGPLKPRRAGGSDSLASAPTATAARGPLATRPAPEPEAEQEKPGAMGWIKSISNRFGKK